MLTAERLREEYLNLLQKQEEEQVYQSYLEEHTRLIPREFVQNHGIGCSLVLRKLSFGNDYKSDFFYFSKSTDDWNAVFIELEKPQSRFFRANSNKFHSDFKNALEQIDTWRAWFDRSGKKEAFLSDVRAIQVPHHMANNPTHMKYVLVFGRRSEYEDDDIRRSKIHSKERDDFKIISFDSLAEGLEQKHELSVGSRFNEGIDILTDQIVDPQMYQWVTPSQLRVSSALQSKLASDPYPNFRSSAGSDIGACKFASEHVRVRPDKQVICDPSDSDAK